MAVGFLDLEAQYRTIAGDVDAAMRQVVESQQFVLGPTVQRFEQAFAEWHGSANAVGVASGTDALLLSLRALELPAGSEVVVPSFTFFATAGAVWNAGLKPVFADVDLDTFNLTAETLRAALTPETRAIVVVHLYGQMAPMGPIMQLARERDLAVIEDVAQAMGARQVAAGEPRLGGMLGDTGAFSFFPTKILGAFGDGGAVISDDADLADRVRKLRVHGGHRVYQHEVVGTNSRLDALQAAVLSTKLPAVWDWIEARRAVALAYDRGLADVPQVRTPAVMDGNEHVYNVYTVQVEERDALQAHLREAGIGSSIYYPLPLHLQPCFAELGGAQGDLPVSEALSERVLSLPIYAELGEDAVAEVCGAIRSFYDS